MTGEQALRDGQIIVKRCEDRRDHARDWLKPAFHPLIPPCALPVSVILPPIIRPSSRFELGAPSPRCPAPTRGGTPAACHGFLLMGEKSGISVETVTVGSRRAPRSRRLGSMGCPASNRAFVGKEAGDGGLRGRTDRTGCARLPRGTCAAGRYAADRGGRPVDGEQHERPALAVYCR